MREIFFQTIPYISYNNDNMEQGRTHFSGSYARVRNKIADIYDNIA